MIIGFTGTRHSMLSPDQTEELISILSSHKVEEFHHGDCVGSDLSAHNIVRDNFPDIRIVIHPPLNRKARAFCVSEYILEEKKYIERNHDIVDACDMLIAAPPLKAGPRSGTMAAIRYAEKKGKPVIRI